MFKRWLKTKDMKAEIPEWVVKYDQAGHQSGAGKAIRILINIIKELQEEINAYEKEKTN